MVYIVIVSYMNYNDTMSCLDSIRNLDFDSYATIVINNSGNQDLGKSLSHDNKTQVATLSNVNLSILQKSKSITIIDGIKNEGFAAANNVAIRLLNDNKILYDYIWFLNNDTLVHEQSLKYLVIDIQRADNNVGIVGSKIMYHKKPDTIQSYGAKYNKFLAACKAIGDGVKDNGQFNTLTNKQYDYVLGASMLVKKEFIDTVGLMNEIYFLYFEELDWIKRGIKKKWSYMISPDSVVYHKGGGATITDGKISEFADAKQIRSRLIFTYLYYPNLLPLITFVVFISIFKRFFIYSGSRSIVIANAIFNALKEIKLMKKNEKN